jgi:protein-disulfide isomerase
MQTKAFVTVAALLLTLLSPPAASAQRRGEGELQRLRREVEELKEGQKALSEQLLELKQLLSEGRGEATASKRHVLNTEGLPFKGDRNSRLTIVEFSDYQCPFCGQHARDTFPQIERDYVKTGKLKYVFGDLPLEEIHPQALKAAKAAGCAAEQGKYWEMHDQLFKNQRALGQGELSLHAQAVGLEVLPFQRCLFGGKQEGSVRQAREVASALGIRGTPTFVIGRTEAGGSKVEVLKVLVGRQSYATFKAALDRFADEGK